MCTTRVKNKTKEYESVLCGKKSGLGSEEEGWVNRKKSCGTE